MRFLSVLIPLLGIISFQSYSQQLIINEVSQGTGSAEYVELLVIGTPSCQTPTPCMDLRGVVLDDNNGYFAAGSGTGIAQGAVRFANNAFWSCIPQGTMIVVYNDNDRNTAIPPDDLSMSDGNCRLIIPVNSNLLEGQSISPAAGNTAYPTTGWFAGAGTWNQVAMSNSGDSFLIMTSISAASPSHAVSYGNNSTNAIIYFSGGASGKVFSMTNNTNNNPSLQANWTSGNVGTNETPGAANNTANSAWIASMNPQCGITNGLQATATATPTGCGPTCTGTVTTTVTGGTAPYSYSWTGSGATTANLSSQCAGTYTVTVTDAGGCSTTAQATVTSSGGATINVTATAVNETCPGACNGSVSATVTGGSAPYSYSWTGNPATTATISNLCPNNYSVTVTDQNGCTGSAQATVAAGTALNVTAGAVNETCTNACNGSVSTTVTGGSAPYSYSWTGNPATTAIISNLCPNNYSVTVTDQNGCTGSAQATVSAGAGLNVTITSSNETCAGACDGGLTGSASGGATPYSYLWSDNSTFANISNKCPGTYSVTVTDQNGCTGNASGTVGAGPAAPDATIITTGPFATTDAPVQFTATTPGGTWTANCGTCISASGVFNPASAGAGTYQICYTVGNGGCSDQDCKSIVVTGCTPQTTSESHSICPGDSYTFNGQTFTNAGSYPFVFTGQNGCDSTHTLNLSVFTVTPSSNNITRCEGDSVIVEGTWYYESDNVVINITDANGCPTTHTTQIVFEDCSIEDYAVFIPNVFTPNNDNINDFFSVSIMGGYLVEGFILNRWGNTIKEFHENDLKWDGRTQDGMMVQDGVYTYVFIISDNNGHKTRYNGFVTVIR
ncbi:gliding motility-associated C-terminal domain-containing protein [Fluviicola sp.]|uniref:T9SS type B sorting domain-containing protein n=1 Tax=Fluviicola sp. TaxID=1917219 RepID=UPI0031E00990